MIVLSLLLLAPPVDVTLIVHDRFGRDVNGVVACAVAETSCVALPLRKARIGDILTAPAEAIVRIEAPGFDATELSIPAIRSR